MGNKKSYPREDGFFPRVHGKLADYARCRGCGHKVQMPCFICASRAAKSAAKPKREATR